MNANDLPSWEACNRKGDRASAQMTALEMFIWENEPADANANHWRRLLAAVLTEAGIQ